MSAEPEVRTCPDCGTTELARHCFEECCAILKEQRDAALTERDAAVRARDMAKRLADEVMVRQLRALRAERDEARAEADILRAELARVREVTAEQVEAFIGGYTQHEFEQGGAFTHSDGIRAGIRAALAAAARREGGHDA